MKRITIAIIILLAITATASAAFHSIQHINTLDDYPDAGRQTWLYHVKSNGAPAISHVSLATSCPCEYVADAGTWEGDTAAPVLDSGGGGAVVEQRSDVCEVKWDKSMSEAEYRDIYLTVNGNFSEQDSTFTIKAGQELTEIVLPGPQCSPTSVTLNHIEAQQKDHAILYAITLALLVTAAAIVIITVWNRITN
jgi:hypothetical protein